MRLNEIKDNPGARKNRVRVGRGIGSGVGKTGGRGGKGQTARTGVAIGGFEGGQMPLHRRLPKRGFNKWDRKSWNEINVGALQQAVDEGKLKSGQSVDVSALIEAGILRRPKDGLRLLGSGELKAKLALTVNHASASAKEAVEKAGGSITLIEIKVLAADEAKRKKSAAKKTTSQKKAAPGAATQEE
ncbi:MAG: 50S ribosomal protein L15 [Hyphomicrobium sp.]|uniref:50S ribosomal protein L15 n=1 Tax=Hyphomicrobium sp. TaxID=82 RepID=UPI003D1161CC